MLSIHLSPRLQNVLQMIPAGLPLADIGSDHAHLSCCAVRDRAVPFAIAGEVRRGPYMQSVANIHQQDLENKISVRLGDGLEVIQPGEVRTIVLAGMGGELITQILEQGKQKLSADTVLILQPNIREPLCRRWLAGNGWRIANECIVEESPHFYEIIKAVKADSSVIINETECLLGPILLQKKSPIFRKKWGRRAVKLTEILRALDKTGETAEIRRKKAACIGQLKRIDLVLNLNGAGNQPAEGE